MEFIQIEVATREGLGSSQTRRLRREGQVPAVLYGLKRKNLTLAIAEPDLERFLKSGSHLIELRMGKETRPAILREIQFDPVTDDILHIDFQRVEHDVEIEDHVAVHFKGRAKGEGEGGVFQALKETIAVRCKPRDLPAEFLLEIAHLAVGDAVRVSDLDVPAGVTVLDGTDDVIAQCAAPKRVAEVEPVEGEVPEGEAPAAEAAEGDAPAGEGGDTPSES